jgi:hypothetical protein
MPAGFHPTTSAPDYMALLPMFMEDINQLDHLLRGADGNKGLLERVGVLEATVTDMKFKVDAIYEHLMNQPKAEAKTETEAQDKTAFGDKLSLKTLWPVLIIALSALLTAIINLYGGK